MIELVHHGESLAAEVRDQLDGRSEVGKEGYERAVRELEAALYTSVA